MRAIGCSCSTSPRIATRTSSTIPIRSASIGPRTRTSASGSARTTASAPTWRRRRSEWCSRSCSGVCPTSAWQTTPRSPGIPSTLVIALDHLPAVFSPDDLMVVTEGGSAQRTRILDNALVLMGAPGCRSDLDAPARCRMRHQRRHPLPLLRLEGGFARRRDRRARLPPGARHTRGAGVTRRLPVGAPHQARHLHRRGGRP